MLWAALAAVDTLADGGISAEVLDMRTIRPIDIETFLRSVRKTSRILIVALGSRGLRRWGRRLQRKPLILACQYLDAPVRRLGAVDSPAPYTRILEAQRLPDQDRIVTAAQSQVYF
jgi:pyruvate dehydrogenase E1 component beta subunit